MNTNNNNSTTNSLEGKNIIITGATSGIAVAWAAELSKEGASVFIGGRREDKGLEVAKQTNSTFHQVDVASEESNKDFFAAAMTHFGGSGSEPTCVDFVFLNAGVSNGDQTHDAATLDIKAYDYIFGVNVRGIISGLKYGTPLLRQQGTLVFTSSIASILSTASLYGASKAAVDSLTRSYAKQFADSDDERLKSLSVYSINPCWYISEMTDHYTDKFVVRHSVVGRLANPSQRPGTPEDLAKTVGEIVKGNWPYTSGANVCVDADTHFPLDEYLSRLEASSTAAAAAKAAVAIKAGE